MRPVRILITVAISIATATPNAGAGPVAPSGAPSCEARPTKASVQPPLHTDGRWIVDRAGRRVKLTGVNWYGAEERDEVVGGLDHQPLDRIAGCIAAMGFNSVRLPFSDALVRDRRPLAQVAPELTARFVRANRALLSRGDGHPARPIDVYAKVVRALARQGLLVILDDHMTANDWCCNADDGNSVWFDQFPGEHCAVGASQPCGPPGTFSEADWVADWRAMVRRFHDEPAVVAVDLRNEVRPDAAASNAPGWGSGPPELDWRRAAAAAGNAVLAENRDLLVVVEGLTFAIDLSGAATAPVELSVPHRLVLSPHTYPWYWSSSAADLPARLDAAWAPFLGGSTPTPVWLGEFGTDTTKPAQPWLDQMLTELDRSDIGWCWWPLNGTQSAGRTRADGSRETFGLLDADWRQPANPDLIRRLRTIAGRR